jgi:single-strand DNA-binding protein
VAYSKETNMSYSSINRVVLVGRLTRDPELRELPSGHSVCNLRVACNGIRRDAEGEYRERPHFFDVATFGGLAESVARYMRKGSLVAIDGRLEWREWETTGSSELGPQKRQAVSVVAETVQFLDRHAGERGEGESGSELGAEDGELGAQDGERELVGAGATGEVDLVF